MSYSIYGGVHPSSSKSSTQDRPTKKSFIPKRVVIPMLQHVGSPAEPLVKAGESVVVGQLIGSKTGFVSSPVHASISGKVTKVGYAPTPTQPRVLSVMIENEGGDQEFKLRPPRDISSFTGEELVNMVRDAGIVGLGGAAFPTYVKLSPPKTKTIDTAILNGAECEPYLTCDHRLMLERPRDILKGLGVVMKILNLKAGFVAIEDNKQSALYSAEKALGEIKAKGELGGVNVVSVKTKYPQGAEKQVIKAVMNRVVPAGGLPMDVGCVVHNVGTAIAIYEAVYFGKPLIERTLTVTGSCIKEPANVLVRVGTLLGDLVEALGGFSKEPAKVIAGGPMMGLAQFTLDVPIVKGMSGVLFQAADEVDRSRESVCIRCGRCVDVCPMGLVPTALMFRVKKEHFAEAKELGASNCYECGACAYACPAKIPLVDYIKFGKSKITTV